MRECTLFKFFSWFKFFWSTIFFVRIFCSKRFSSFYFNMQPFPCFISRVLARWQTSLTPEAQLSLTVCVRAKRALVHIPSYWPSSHYQLSWSPRRGQSYYSLILRPSIFDDMSRSRQLIHNCKVAFTVLGYCYMGSFEDNCIFPHVQSLLAMLYLKSSVSLVW